jgi:hypothetical protein
MAFKRGVMVYGLHKTAVYFQLMLGFHGGTPSSFAMCNVGGGRLIPKKNAHGQPRTSPLSAARRLRERKG